MISVVIPIYNVEKYLEQCIKSVINQTYRDLEIILVDDGSTDRSGDICDYYKTQDNRITVIHKENGGLSSARNVGIDLANGKYICFIDSDDFVDLSMLEIMEKEMKRADVVICGKEDIWKESIESVNREEEVNENICMMTGENAFEHFLLEDKEGYVVAWNKLYHTDDFKKNSIRYPEGKIHEDCFTTYKLLLNAKKVAFVNMPLYKYRHREGSIMYNKNLTKDLSIIEAYSEIMTLVDRRFPQYIQAATYRYILANLFCADRCIYDENRKYLLEISENIKKSGWHNNKFLRGQQRARTIVLCYIPKVYPNIRRIINMVREKKNENKV